MDDEVTPVRATAGEDTPLLPAVATNGGSSKKKTGSRDATDPPTFKDDEYVGVDGCALCRWRCCLTGFFVRLSECEGFSGVWGVLILNHSDILSFLALLLDHNPIYFVSVHSARCMDRHSLLIDLQH